MIRLTDFSECSPQGCYPPDRTLRDLCDVADGDFIPAAILREAHYIADRFPPAKARPLILELFRATCSTGISRADREMLLERLLASRRESKHAFLEGMGLARDPEEIYGYLPGSWRLTIEQSANQCLFVIHGVRRADGEFVSVRLTHAQFTHAGASLRAIRKAVGAGDDVGLSAWAWRRLWRGFDAGVGSGCLVWVRGLRFMLIDQLKGVTR